MIFIQKSKLDQLPQVLINYIMIILINCAFLCDKFLFFKTFVLFILKLVTSPLIITSVSAISTQFRLLMTIQKLHDL